MGASTKAKISINVWRPVWSKLEKTIEAGCLNRDAYIGAVIDKELDRLVAEMPIANSKYAQDFIDAQLRSLLKGNSTPLSLSIDAEVAEKLKTICESKRLVRDAFFNRLFLFMSFGTTMAGKLFFRFAFDRYDSEKPDSWTKVIWEEWKHDGPFFSNVFEPLSAHLDPLWAIHAGFSEIEMQDKPEYVDWVDPESKETVQMRKWVPETFLCLPSRFYTAFLTDSQLVKAASAHSKVANQKPEVAFHNLYGLNCYLPNFLATGHEENKLYEAESEKMFAEL